MQLTIQLAILGVVTGAAYGLAGIGLVAIYKGSGVLNFAQGAIGMVGTYVYAIVMEDTDNKVVATAAGMLTSALVGVLTYVLVMRPLRAAPTLAKVVATLGVLVFLQNGATIVFGTDRQVAPSLLTSSFFSIGPYSVPWSGVIMLVAGIALTALLAVYYRYTIPGLATEAASIDEPATVRLGYRATLLGAGNWALGSALGGLTGIMLVGNTGLSQAVLTLIVIKALAAAIVGGFRSVTLTFAAAVGIGVTEGILVGQLDSPGWKDAVPFIVIVVALLVRGDAIPGRRSIAVREVLPAAPMPRVRLPVVIPVLVVLVALPFWLSTYWEGVLAQCLAFGLIGLSVVLLTGYLGQVSLAQWAFAGIGALLGGSLVADHGWPLPLAALGAIAVAFAIGALLAVPALRIRGVALAVVTLGFGSTIQAVWFKDTWGVNPLNLPSADVFGWRFGTFGVYVMCLVVLVATCIGMMALRRSRVGEQMLAIRASERAAAACGFNIPLVKITTFGASAAMAAVGGLLFSYGARSVNAETFLPFQSIFLLALVFLHGVGAISGGATIGTFILVPAILVELDVSRDWFGFIAGGLVAYAVIRHPSGAGGSHAAKLEALEPPALDDPYAGVEAPDEVASSQEVKA